MRTFNIDKDRLKSAVVSRPAEKLNLLLCSVSALFGMTRRPTQRRGSWIPPRGRTESGDGCRGATSPYRTNTFSRTDRNLKVNEQPDRFPCSKPYLVFKHLISMLCSETVKPPLAFLFEDKTHSFFSSTVKDKATSESIR